MEQGEKAQPSPKMTSQLRKRCTSGRTKWNRVTKQQKWDTLCLLIPKPDLIQFILFSLDYVGLYVPVELFILLFDLCRVTECHMM